jgi:hypothetical protein
VKKFNVGDRVKCIQTYDGRREAENKVGTVIATSVAGNIGVEFDEFINGHNCNSRGKPGYCWYLPEEYFLKLVKAKTIEVYGIVKFMRGE